MKVHHLMQEAAQALRTNKLRSALTVVGIVVGIFAVTAMLALGEGLSENILKRMSSFAQGDVSLSGPLTTQDLTWVTAMPYTEAAIGIVTTNAVSLVAFDKEYTVSLESVLGDLEAVQQYKIVAGSTFDFTDEKVGDAELVVTTDLRETVRNDTGQEIVGTYASLGGKRFRVVGAISSESAGFRRTDGTVYVPYRATIGTFTSASTFSSIGVKLKDSSYFQVAGEHLQEGLNASRHLPHDTADLFSVSSAQSIIESAQQTTSMISLFLGIVGGIALFVGGIGTMNMMLTTVTERTKEIGLRKAIGARRRDILLQVLFESILLTLIGGVLGILLTSVGAYFANKALAGSQMISIIVSPYVVALATGVAFAVGIVFGLYPAARASKLQPVDALRGE